MTAFRVWSYEIRGWLRRPAPYLYASGFFLFALVAFLGSGGFFDENTPEVGTVRLLNSPHEIHALLQYLGKLMLFLPPALVGATIYRDFQHDAYRLMYSFPVPKLAYLSGKFVAGFTVVLGIALLTVGALVLGEGLLGSSNPYVGPFRAVGYVQALGVYLLPNLFVGSVLTFVVVGWSRNIYLGFIAVLLLVVVQTVVENLFPDAPFLRALFDPFGQHAVAFGTHFWTLAEQNRLPLPLSMTVIYNRLFWIGVAGSVGFVFFRSFALTYTGPQINFFSKKRKKTRRTFPRTQDSLLLSDTRPHATRGKQLKRIGWLTGYEFRFLVRQPSLWVFGAMGVATVVFMLLRVTQRSDMVMLPLTRLVLQVPKFFYLNIVVVLTFILAGQLLHRMRAARMDELVGVTATPSWVMLLAKIFALVGIQLLLLVGLMVCGLSFQLAEGFREIALDHYGFDLMLLTAPGLIVWALVAIIAHILIPNLYVGIFALLLLWVGQNGFDELGISTYLLRFNDPPRLVYSDFGGYGGSLNGYFWVRAYWLAFAAMLGVVGYLFWERERAFSVRDTILRAKSRLRLPVILLFGGAFLGLGIFIFRAEHSPDRLASDANALAHFTSQFSAYNALPQPRITRLDLQLDLYPAQNRFQARGTYTLVNKTDAPIDTLLLRTGFDERTTYRIVAPNHRVTFDSALKFFVHRLNRALLPGDSLALDFAVESSPNTLFQRNSNVLTDGTFLKFDLLPRLGYPAIGRRPHPADSSAANNHYQAVDSDLIEMSTTVSTSADQLALAPGHLRKSWQENGRAFFHYETQRPIKMGGAFNSGRYAVFAVRDKDLEVEVYHHPRHDWNTGRMVDGLKAAFAYNSHHFGPYPRKEMRIIEFPLTEGSYATTFANAILISEQRFGVDARDSLRVDLPFYVTAHEMTHQWFGHQLIPRDARGALMLTESLTEYITLNLYEARFGAERTQQFLRLQRRRYLEGRSRLTDTEPPLVLVEAEQDAISYGKGAIVFRALAHYFGEDHFNQILREFLDQHQPPSYPTSLDLLRHLRDRFPDSLQYLLTDGLETVTRHDNTLHSVELSRNDDGSFSARVDFSVKKYREGQTGTPLPLNDFVELGFYDKQGRLFATERLRIRQARSQRELRLARRPDRVVLDPGLLTIELDVDDNRVKVGN